MKVAIITQYYKSKNYGGNLQAYALCKVINNLGYDAEQICLIGKKNASVNHVSKYKNIRDRFQLLPKRIKHKIYTRMYENNIKTRNEALDLFNKSVIKHSMDLYYSDCMDGCAKKYDCFITGSDQVWNTFWYAPVYFLEFVENKPKFSYAASIGKNSLDKFEQNIFKSKLKDYIGISVRESDSVELLSNIGVKNVDFHLDPTLLLSEKDWDEICAVRMIAEEYVLGFFLTGNPKFRKVAKKFAKKMKLKYVELPYYQYNFHFKDKSMYGVGPEKFISLIKNARCIFTDSFHSCVFSLIYNKDFFAFKRTDFAEMSSRILTLLDVFSCKDRLIDYNQVNIDELMNYKNERNIFTYLSLREKSINYLKRMLAESEKSV